MSNVNYNSTDIISILRTAKKQASEKLENETVEFKEYKDETLCTMIRRWPKKSVLGQF